MPRPRVRFWLGVLVVLPSALTAAPAASAEGWYLLLPPPWPVPPRVNTLEVLSRWELKSRHESKEACERAIESLVRDRTWAVYGPAARRGTEVDPRRQQWVFIAWESQCVASDDPRLLRAAPVVQWYLLLPPALVPPAVDTRRPLVEWQPVEAYDSAEKCQRDRERIIREAFEVWEVSTEDAKRRGQPRDPESAQLFLQYWGSRCVAEAELGTK